MLEILQLSLDILNSEAKTFGLEVNWLKTKVQFVGDAPDPPATVAVCNDQVEVVDSFVYLGSMVHNTGSSEPMIRRRIEIARSKMTGSTETSGDPQLHYVRNSVCTGCTFFQYSCMDVRLGPQRVLCTTSLTHLIGGADDGLC